MRESHEGVVISSLVDQLLSDIYRCSKSEFERSESESTVSSFRPHLKHRYLQRTRLQFKCKIRKCIENLVLLQNIYYIVDVKNRGKKMRKN